MNRGDEAMERVGSSAAPDTGGNEPLNDDSIIVLSGLSGAGKTTALQALEDLGYLCVDNLPPSLWAPLARHAGEVGEDRVAVCADVRTAAFLHEVEDGLAALADLGKKVTVVFLTASEETLVKRYNLTRRTHPLSEGTLSHDIAAEQEALAGIRKNAHRVIDTTRLSAKELGQQMMGLFAHERPFALRLVSFGFKRGAPIDADLVLDVRALPNPYYEAQLRSLPGTEERVQEHVFTPNGLELYSQLRSMVKNLASLARDGGRTSYTVALGCTGGQHRSVAVVEKLAHDLAQDFTPSIDHRDLAHALEEHKK